MRHLKIGTAFAALFAVFLFLGCQDEEATGPHIHILESVQVEPDSPSLMEGETVELSATPTCVAGHPLDLPVTWSSADESVATVDESGVVTALYEGGAEISAEATADEKTVTGAAGVFVNRDGTDVDASGGIVTYSSSEGDAILDVPAGAVAQATKISIRPSPADVAAGKPDLATGSAFHFRPEGLSFQSEATLTIRYRQGGLAEGTNEARLKLFHHQNGQWTEMSDSRVDTETRSVKGEITDFSHYAVAESGLTPVAQVIVEGNDIDNVLMLGETMQLTATLLDADGNVLEGRQVDWSSSDESVARVSENGLVTAVATGEVEITARSEGQHGHAGVGVGSGKGNLYADLVFLYRSEEGLPIMRELGGETCRQPVSYSAVPDVSPVTNPVNGEDVWLLPLVGDETTSSQVISSHEEGEDEELEACDVQLDYQEYMSEVEIGRLNVGRSPTSVLDRALSEVYARLDTASTVEIDHAGRFVVDDFPLEDPPGNLAIQREVVLTGALGPHTIVLDELAPDAYVNQSVGYLDWASTGMGAGADKFGEVNTDMVVYYDRIMNFPNDVTASGMPTITGDGTEGVEGRKYLDYRAFEYDRAATFPGCVVGYELVGEEMQEIRGTLMDVVFGGEQFTGSNLHAFAQRTDDVREVILFEHEIVIVDIDHIGESTVCEERGIQ